MESTCARLCPAEGVRLCGGGGINGPPLLEDLTSIFGELLHLLLGSSKQRGDDCSQKADGEDRKINLLHLLITQPPPSLLYEMPENENGKIAGEENVMHWLQMVSIIIVMGKTASDTVFMSQVAGSNKLIITQAERSLYMMKAFDRIVSVR